MNSMKINNIINKILAVFLIIQPIFDIKPFYNSISTLIRVIIIYTLFAYYFFTSKNKKKYYLLIYPILLGIYFIFHHLHALNFYSLVPGNFNYTIIEEALYFVKMVSPFLLIYCLYKSNFTVDRVLDIMKYLVLIIGLTIVLSNLLGFSYGSYSDKPIKANFFEWFNAHTNYTYTDLASKGLFVYGNQISAILIMFLPFVIYTVINKPAVKNCFILFLNIFALIFLCTKVSVLGIFVVCFYTMFTFGFISFIFKKHFVLKQYLPIGITLLVCCLLLPINPMFNRIQERVTVAENYNSQDENEIITDTKKPVIEENLSTTLSYDEMMSYIEANYQIKKVSEQFIYTNYPCQYDPEFWYNFLHNDIWKTTDYRYIELSMIKRVVEINNNQMDKWFGITNTRLQNIFNIERDFVVQYYALGIIGAILVFVPYITLLIVFAYTTLRNKFKNLNTIRLLAAITIVFLLGISYLTGNLFNSLSFTIYFTLCFKLIQIEKER